MSKGDIYTKLVFFIPTPDTFIYIYIYPWSIVFHGIVVMEKKNDLYQKYRKQFRTVLSIKVSI
jgi:hypothetical protein